MTPSAQEVESGKDVESPELPRSRENRNHVLLESFELGYERD